MEDSTRHFYLHTGLDVAHLDAVRERISRLRVEERYEAIAYEGIVAVMGLGSHLFARLSEAAIARRILLRGAPEVFGEVAIAFIETDTPDDRPVARVLPEPVSPFDYTKTAVYVEDDHISAQQVRSALAELRVDCEIVSEGGHQALMLIEDLEPDLVLLSLGKMSDGMHAWELVKRMKANEVIRDIPVIVIAGNQSSQDEIFAHMVVGAKDYLLKPVDLAKLCRSVYQTLAGVMR